MKTPILGSYTDARSVNAADNRMINLFPEIIPEGGKEPAYLTKRPGLVKWAYADGSGSRDTFPIRGMISTYDLSAAGTPAVLYVVVGGDLYTTRDNVTWTNLGTIAATTAGSMVSMASSGTEVFIATDAGTSYIVTIATDTLTQITDADFPGARSVVYLDGYFVFCNQTDQKVWCTDLLNGLSINPLNFASAEMSPDPVIGLAVNNDELWVFGTKTAEVWSNAGNAGFPFAPIQGASLNVGCLGNFAISQLDGSLFWFGQDASGYCAVYRSNGYSAQRISTHTVEWNIQSSYKPLVPTYTNPEYAPYSLSYQQDGHVFYMLGLSSANGAGSQWVYDVTTQAWHQRTYGSESETVRCSATFVELNATADAYAGVLFGGSKYNVIYNMYPTAYSDEVAARVPDPTTYQTIDWVRSWRALPQGANNLKRTAHHSLQIDCQTGIQGIPAVASPVMSLRWSDDGGNSWNTPRTASMGAASSYATRVIWRRLGMTMKLRDRVYEISGSDAVRVVIAGAELIVSPTDA